MNEEVSLQLPQSPEPAATASSPALMVVTAVLSLVLWAVVVVQLVIYVPKVEKIFNEFRMKTPLLTEYVIRDSRWAVPTIAVAAFLACLAFGRRSSWPWVFVLMALPLALGVLLGVSLYFPYMELLEGLEGGKK